MLAEAHEVQPVGRLAMAKGRAQLEWSPEMVASKRPIAPTLYAPEAGLHEARTRDFEGLHGFLADSLPEGWGSRVMKRRLGKLDVRWDDLSVVDRLALVGRQGRGALLEALRVERGPKSTSAFPRAGRFAWQKENSSLGSRAGSLNSAR